MSEDPRYPKVLADWNFHGEHYQCWNQQERMWIVHEKVPESASPLGVSEWELVSQW